MDVINGSTFGSLLVGVILGLLYLFAFFYDRWVGSLGMAGEGWAWAEVIGGVFVTLIAIGLLDLFLPMWNAFFTGLMAFVVSGFPMARGAWTRHQEAMQRARKAMKE